MPRHATRRTAAALVAAAAVLLLLAPGALRANMSDSGPKTDPRLGKASRLIEQGRYDQAIPVLQALVQEQPRNADAYNLLGYAHRKLGRLQEALRFYAQALRIQPGHRGAHEYLGEAYLELGQPDQAKAQLAILDKDCWLGCEEYSDLKAAIARYEAAKR